MNRLRKYSVYVTVFLTSLAGANLGGVSITKIAFIPLMLVLFPELKRSVSINEPAKRIFLYYFIIILSSVFALFRTDLYVYDTYKSKVAMNILQFLIIYIPTCWMLLGSRKIQDYRNYFVGAIVKLAQINCLWALIQFVFWTIWKIDFNNLLFVEIIHGFLGDQWSVYNQSIENGILIKNLRISGLNFEPACFSFVMLLGYIYDNKRWHKILYILLLFISLSRTGIVVAAFILFFDGISAMRHMKRSTLKKAFGAFALLIVLLVGIMRSPIGAGVYNQVCVLMARFALIGNSNVGDGTYRHIMYIFWAIQSWLFSLNPLQKMIGIGYRVSGVVFSENLELRPMLQSSMVNQAWAIENDYADILLGTGIMGFFSIYSFFHSIYVRTGENVRKAIKMILVFGVFYNATIWTFTSLFLLYLLTEAICASRECSL